MACCVYCKQSVNLEDYEMHLFFHSEDIIDALNRLKLQPFHIVNGDIELIEMEYNRIVKELDAIKMSQ